jgi:hypothetical protein
MRRKAVPQAFLVLFCMTRYAETRKIAAILVAKVVGYPRLAGADEAATAKAVARAPWGGSGDREASKRAAE